MIPAIPRNRTAVLLLPVSQDDINSFYNSLDQCDHQPLGKRESQTKPDGTKAAFRDMRVSSAGFGRVHCAKRTSR